MGGCGGAAATPLCRAPGCVQSGSATLTSASNVLDAHLRGIGLSVSLSLGRPLRQIPFYLGCAGGVMRSGHTAPGCIPEMVVAPGCFVITRGVTWIVSGKTGSRMTGSLGGGAHACNSPWRHTWKRDLDRFRVPGPLGRNAAGRTCAVFLCCVARPAGVGIAPGLQVIARTR